MITDAMREKHREFFARVDDLSKASMEVLRIGKWLKSLYDYGESRPGKICIV